MVQKSRIFVIWGNLAIVIIFFIITTKTFLYMYRAHSQNVVENKSLIFYPWCSNWNTNFESWVNMTIILKFNLTLKYSKFITAIQIQHNLLEKKQQQMFNPCFHNIHVYYSVLHFMSVNGHFTFILFFLFPQLNLTKNNKIKNIRKYV